MSLVVMFCDCGSLWSSSILVDVVQAGTQVQTTSIRRCFNVVCLLGVFGIVITSMVKRSFALLWFVACVLSVMICFFFLLVSLLRFVALPGYLVYCSSTAFGARAKEKSQEGQVQSNVNSSNIFWTMEICSRHGCSSY